MLTNLANICYNDIILDEGGARMRYENGAVRADIYELCELALRRGDLDSRRAPDSKRADREADTLRSRRVKEGSLTAEVCEISEELGNIGFCITGELFFSQNGEKTVIEDIRTVHSFFAFRTPSSALLLPLRCAAYLYCVKNSLSGIDIRLTLMLGDKEKYVESYADADSLRIDIQSVLSAVFPRAEQVKIRAEQIIPSVRDTAAFPYGTLREGQDILIKECYRTVRSGKRLFAQAPTGIGKTISTLYPAARAIGDGACDKIFYLTARASTRREAFAAAKKLFLSGAKLRTCVISAKEQMCACEAAKGGKVSSYCNPDDCPYAKGYYDRADEAIFELLGRCNGYSRSAIEETAIRHGVCPYELSLDISEFCDIIICDYNYAFDPSAYFRRYFAPEAEAQKYVFLIDEAHNLPDRARDMYSVELKRSDFERVYAKVRPEDSELDSALSGIILSIRGLRRLCRDDLVKAEDGERGFYMSRQALPGFPDKLRAFLTECERWLRDKREHPLYAAVSELCASARKYLRISEYYDERFLTYVEILGGDTRVRIFCLDPSGVIGDRLKKARSAVFFSATLTPLDYFRELLGDSEEYCPTLELASPFDPENLCVAAVDTVSTKSDDRDERTYRRIATYIAATVSAKAGNYICYFPSYSFMEAVQKAFCRKYPKVRTVVQRRAMTLSQKESFLSAFKNDTGVLRVGFCVLGGSFSEGVDLPGSRLIGSIVVGVGIPGLSNERNIIRDYYEEKNGRGYDYSYSFPGMNSVLQAAGRVIRRDDDRGVVVLIDTRYGEPLYRHMFPEHWRGMQFAGDPASLAEIMRRFWKKHEKT